jgi:mRNA interferase MazF
VSGAGEYGKPRPSVIVQSNQLTGAGLDSVIVCLVTSDVGHAASFRVAVEPSPGNGLKAASQIMVDKLVAVRVARIGKIIGRLDDETLFQLNRTLAFVVGLAE